MGTMTNRLSDAALPGLHVALDAESVMEMLSLALPECAAGMRLLDVRVSDVQYAPGSMAHVLWKLRVHDPVTGLKGRQLVCIRVLRRDEAPPAEPVDLVRRYAERRARPGIERATPLRTPWLYLPGAHLVMHAFPLDPLLPTLLDVTDPAVIRDALHTAWQPRGLRVRSVHAETLSYTPEARAALRMRVVAEDKLTGMPEVRRLVGKLHVSRAPDRLFAGHWAVWRGAGGRGVAPPAGYVSQAQLSLQEFVDGRRLSDLAGTGSFLGLTRRAAHAIARVHALTLPVLATRRVEKEMAVVERWIGILSRLRPQHAARLEQLGRRLRRELAERMRISSTIHADFHLANILTADGGVTIIDWDQAAHGDPMVDIGRVLASLRVSSLRVHGRLDGFADIEAGFLDAYLQRTGEDERRARLFEAVSLLIAAAGPFRLQREGWEEGAELMLGEVERTLELSLRGARVAGTPPDLKRQVPFHERTGWILDRTYSQALLVPLIHAHYGSDIEVTECVPSLCATGQDAVHARWILKGYRGPERWRATVEGIGSSGNSSRGVLRRLQLACEVLNHSHPGTLQLPRPIGHMEPLSLLVFEPPAGEPAARVLARDDEHDAVLRLGNSLARFHALELELDKEHETARALRSVARRLDRLERAPGLDAASARVLFDALRAHIEARGERRAPIVLGLHLGRLRLTSHGAGVAAVADIVNGDPLLVIGELVADLHMHSSRNGGAHSAAAELATAYANAAGEAPVDVAAFAALLLLRRACRTSDRAGGAAHAGSMLAAAAGMFQAAQ
jgi:aminoglycoside phosphotransferase (APT) family kinase protein